MQLEKMLLAKHVFETNNPGTVGLSISGIDTGSAAASPFRLASPGIRVLCKCPSCIRCETGAVT